MSPGFSRCSGLPAWPWVNTGGCSTRQSSSGVSAVRAAVKAPGQVRTAGYELNAEYDYNQGAGSRGPRLIEGFVNGVRRQHGSTSNLIFPIEFLIEYITFVMTLEPGDVIATFAEVRERKNKF